MLISSETAKDDYSLLASFEDLESIKSYISDLGQELSQLRLSKEQKESIVAALQSTLFSGRLKPAAEDDVYQNEFQDGEFEKGYEEQLYRRWMSSKSVEERKQLALEGYRTLIGLEPGAELKMRDKDVIKDLSDSAAKDDLKAGWSEYLQKLAWQKLQARFWR
ncbi:hypothetical protein FFLO_05010 [Filobasidium floriforme]|uniref:Uncharacterized protein n=1 Tax=Filobasidium floriforme TaxID=5210 RepID=A0A8K0JHP7_9TREE|nr:uncharacterized protein HD553DRAFT_340724 [Filobasidium floriforme]KAG7530469.1 hypothetical protein FFLO_05010 [Filobasidium floriforme]KAH8087549.1 hypothetical protein HD553DRAFT_340724 [Filobasidium floriforme]